VDVLDYLARAVEFKKKSERAARKRAKQEAADRALRAAEVLAAAAAADDSDNSDSEAGNKAELVRVDPQSSVLPQVAEMHLKESQEALASFEQDAAAVGTARGLSDEEVKQLKSEHAAWRSFFRT
jgi:FtsZ-binding cell division protein ZapB